MDNIIAIMAVWRLTSIVVEEYGMYGIFSRIRARTRQWGLIDLDCFWCTSVWTSGIMVLYMGNPVEYAFFYSAGAIIINQLFNKLDV